MNSYAIKYHIKVHPVGAHYLLNQNMSRLNIFCSYFSSYQSCKFKKIQFARSEMAYCQLSCKFSAQDTVIIIGSLGHPQLSEYSSEDLMPLSALLLELFHVETDRREHFAKSDTNIQRSNTPDCFWAPRSFLYHQKAYGMHFSEIWISDKFQLSNFPISAGEVDPHSSVWQRLPCQYEFIYN